MHARSPSRYTLALVGLIGGLAVVAMLAAERAGARHASMLEAAGTVLEPSELVRTAWPEASYSAAGRD